MAKKVRTPPPPRRIQAPQKRATKRPPRAGGDRRRLWGIIGILVLVALAAIAAALYFALRGKTSPGATKITATTAASNRALDALPGVRKTKAPWKPEYAHLDSRLGPLGLKAATQEQSAYHIHQHLDVFLNGKRLVVPACIGILDCKVYITELHTHATDGVIHNENESARKFTLGQFFAEWGVFLNSRCVGAYCQGFTWYVNGKRQTGNPQNLVLDPHLEIAIAIGKPPRHLPSTYNWAGL